MRIPHKKLLIPATVGVVAGVILEGPIKSLWGRVTGLVSGAVSGVVAGAPKKPETVDAEADDVEE